MNLVRCNSVVEGAGFCAGFVEFIVGKGAYRAEVSSVVALYQNLLLNAALCSALPELLNRTYIRVVGDEAAAVSAAGVVGILDLLEMYILHVAVGILGVALEHKAVADGYTPLRKEGRKVLHGGILGVLRRVVRLAVGSEVD